MSRTTRIAALVLSASLIASAAMADPPPRRAPTPGAMNPNPMAPDPKDAQIATLQQQLDQANQKGAWWMQLAQAEAEELHAHAVTVVAATPPQQPQGPRQ
jgi:hypothetical protein